MDKSTSQPKLKSDAVHFPAKDLKEKDLHSEHLTIRAKTTFQSPPRNPVNVTSRIQVVYLLEEKKNLEANVEFDKQRTELLTTQEENNL
eukprot:bmy_07757T0